MRKGIIGSLTTLTTALVVAIAPGVALAAPVVEDFETPPVSDGAQVAQQFRPGVYFTANLGDGIQLPKMDVDATKARSGSHMLNITTGSGEFPAPGLEGRFDTVVTDLTVHVRRVTGPTTVHPRLRVVAYGVAGGSKASSFLDISSTSWTALTVPTATPGNSYSRFQVVAEDTSAQGWEFRVDDVTFTLDPAATPDYDILTEDIGGVVLPGDPKQYTIDIQRLNSFSESVSFSGASTVPGSSVSFSPSSTTGDSTTLTLTLPQNAANSSSETLTVIANGSPGTRMLEIPFVVEQPFTLSVAGPTQLQAYPCATSDFQLSVFRNRFFSDPIDLEVREPSGEPVAADLGAVIDPARLDSGGTGTNAVTVHVTRGDAPTDLTPDRVQVLARSGSITRTLDFDVVRASPRLTSTAPMTLFTPQSLLGGSAITVRGNGFCPGARVQFGNDRAIVAGTLTGAPTADNPGQVQLTAVTPRLATSGPIGVVNPSGASGFSSILTGTTVYSYRNRFGFNFVNENGAWDGDDADEDGNPDEPRPVGAGSLRDWQELLGPSQTNLNACEVGLLFPGCWDVITPIPTPQHGIMQTILGEATLYNRGGTCVGLSIASRRIAAGQVTVENRPADGLAAPVWSLQRTGRETIPGRGDIPLEGRQHMSPIKYAAIQHAAQLTAEYVRLWATRRATNAISGLAPMRRTLESELRSGRRPLININYDGGGHAVNVYDIEDLPDGGFRMHVYDNNYPFLPEENSRGGDHEFYEGRSTIDVSSAGNWTAHGLRRVTARDDEGEPTETAPRRGAPGDISWVTVESELPRVPHSLATLDGLRVLATPNLGSLAAPARAAAEGDSGVMELGYLDGEGSMLAADSDRSRSIRSSPARAGRPTSESSARGPSPRSRRAEAPRRAPAPRAATR